MKWFSRIKVKLLKLVCKVFGHRWKVFVDEWGVPWPLYCTRCESIELRVATYDIRDIQKRWEWRKKRGLENELRNGKDTIEFLDGENKKD